MSDNKVTVADGMAGMPGPDLDNYVVVLRHGTLEIGLYAPRGKDDQTPHSRDEVYVVWKGKGAFRVGADRLPFVPGDVLFVPAGVDHRFEEFSDDLALWVMFYGPEGGEMRHEG